MSGRHLRLFLIVGLGLAAVAAFVYRPAIDGGFIWDDNDFLTHNPLNGNLRGLWAIWSSFSAPDYWPLTYSAFWLEWRLWGDVPRGYHLVNIFLHVAAALLVAAVLRHLGARGWWLVALLFVAHPVNVESVAWISQQKTLLATALLFAATLLYVRGRSSPEAWTAQDTLALGAFSLALLAKTSVVAFPIALVGYESLRRVPRRADLLRTVPFFLASLAGGLLTIACNAAHHTGVVHHRGTAERIAGMGAAAWAYLEKALVPTDLCFVYPRWQCDPTTLGGWLPDLAWLAVLGILAPGARTWARVPLAGLGWYLIMLAPSTGLVDIYFLSYAPVADHYQYQSLPGLLALVVHPLAVAAERIAVRLAVSRATAAIAWRCATGAVALVATAVLADAARTRAAVYVDAETLWRDTLRRNPDSELAHNNLGAILRDRGDDAAALDCYREVLRIDGQSAATAVAETNLRGLTALRAFRAGRLREAAAELDALLAAPHFPHRHLAPEAVAALYDLRGKIATLAGDEATAARMAAVALAGLPGDAEAGGSVLLATARSASGSDEQALYAACADVVARYPGTFAAARAHHEAGRIARRRGETEFAAKHFQAALRIEPHAIDTRLAHAETLADLGLADAARATLEPILEAEPSHEAAARLRERLGDPAGPRRGSSKGHAERN